MFVVSPFKILDCFLRQHRIMGQGDSARDFDTSMKNAGILDVFPIFHTARLGQKIRRRPQFPLCGAALEFPAEGFPPLDFLPVQEVSHIPIPGCVPLPYGIRCDSHKALPPFCLDNEERRQSVAKKYCARKILTEIRFPRPSAVYTVPSAPTPAGDSAAWRRKSVPSGPGRS